jgi:hypothetical protein
VGRDHDVNRNKKKENSKTVLLIRALKRGIAIKVTKLRRRQTHFHDNIERLQQVEADIKRTMENELRGVTGCDDDDSDNNIEHNADT